MEDSVAMGTVCVLECVCVLHKNGNIMVYKYNPYIMYNNNNNNNTFNLEAPPRSHTLYNVYIYIMCIMYIMCV